jgi:putative sterol carrier protein
MEKLVKYATQEWCDLYKEALNKSKAWTEAAKTWEGDFIFITEKGGPIKEPLYEYLDLWHGECRKCEMITDPSKYNPEFIMTAPYPIWKRIITKELDSIQALITKQSRLLAGSRGTMGKIMRYTKAANELTNCTKSLPTEWWD